MITREELERREEAQLHPRAARSADSRGRAVPEPLDPFRTCFLRDRDRILHSAAFRRLQLKTQVLCVVEGDYFRTRLTHTLEVWQMASSAATALGLNPDLAQAVALAHDLGHPPFGHAGERALAGLMAGHGGFAHNAQGARLVDVLEQRSPAYRGLNLTFETRLSLLKHAPPPGFPLASDLAAALAEAPPLEARLVDLADAAAYLHHDLDDALHSGLVTPAETVEIALWREAREELEHEGLRGPGPGGVTQVLARMIKRVNQDLIHETARALEPAFSPVVSALLAELGAFLRERFYRAPAVLDAMGRAAGVLERLFDRFRARPEAMPAPYQALIPTWGLERAVVDYLAGMTDRFAWTLAGEDPARLSALDPPRC